MYKSDATAKRCVMSLNQKYGQPKIWSTKNTVTLGRTELGLALCHDEVGILIFDDPAEQEKRERPRSGLSPVCVLFFFPPPNITIAK